MSNEANQTWPKSKKDLNACTATEEFKIVASKAKITDAIYIPETNEIVVLTSSEYTQLSDMAEAYDYYIREVIKANESGNKQNIVTAKNNLADFFESEKKTALGTKITAHCSVRPLVVNKDTVFIEVIQLSNKKTSYVPRFLIESFRKKEKIYELKGLGAGKDGTSRIDKTVSNPFTTTNGELDTKNLLNRFGAVNAEMSVDLGSGTLPMKWSKGFEGWIKSLNENLNYIYNDREIRKKKLVAVIDPAQTDADHQSPMLSEQTILTNMQSEVNAIWGRSTSLSDKALVVTVNQRKWSRFCSDLSHLSKNCRYWAKRINDTPTIKQQKCKLEKR